MCTMYWNLTVDGPAPCGHEITTSLQTHFMGEACSCLHYYRVGDQVPELESYTGTLPADDWLIGDCERCGAWYEFDAVIEAGRVVQLADGKVVS